MNKNRLNKHVQQTHQPNLNLLFTLNVVQENNLVKQIKNLIKFKGKH